MKKWKIIFIFTLLLLIGSSSVFAAKDDIIQVNINGSDIDVRQVAVFVDGQALESEIPSFIHVDRTLVPVRFVAENYGAKVDWEQKTKTAIITYEDKEIKVTIDSPMATLNGETKVLDKNSIPRLVTFGNEDARTMVPLTFISEILGYEVGYDEVQRVPYIKSNNDIEDDKNEEDLQGEDELEDDQINIISQIYLDKGSTDNEKIVIKSSGKIRYESTIEYDSKKLIIDIQNTKLDVPNTGDEHVTIPIKDENIKKLSYSQYSRNPYITRIEVEMNGILDYDIVESKDKKTNVISFPSKIGEIKLENINGKQVISIEGAGNTKYSTMRLSNPERIVVDLLDASLREGTYFNYDYDLGFIKGIRGSQFAADSNYSSIDRIVRVVLDVKEGAEGCDIRIDSQDDKLTIFPEKSIWEYISYDVDGKHRSLNIENLEKTSYLVENYPELKMLEIRIPSEATELEDGVGKTKDGLVDEINVTRNKDEVVVQIRYKRSIEFEVTSKKVDHNINLNIRRNSNIKPSDRLIVIDPGHGGRYPGAISPNGTREKDINLSISLKTEKALKDLGYNVLMTRDIDEYIGLYDRTDLANENYADIFVSFHANSFGNRNIYGIQVLYCPAQKGNNKDMDQYPLAKSVMDELLKGTGANDKGIIQRPDIAVLRTSNMPAILIEVGFLTNEDEEKLIKSDEYQNKIVESTIKGIENYFEIY